MQSITCSAGKGEYAVEKCLECARTGNAECGYDYVVLKSMLASHEDRSQEIHVTDLIGCLRSAWYRKTTPVAEYPHEIASRWIGTTVHSFLEETDAFLTSEMPVDHHGITGRIDILYNDGRLVDLKTTRWLDRAKLPYGSHALQVNLYAYLARKSGRKANRLQIQYIDMSGPTKCRRCKLPLRHINGELRCPECMNVPSNAHGGAMLVDVPVMADNELEPLLKERQEELQVCLDTGILPDQHPGYLCGYCAYRNICKPTVSDE